MAEDEKKKPRQVVYKNPRTGTYEEANAEPTFYDRLRDGFRTQAEAANLEAARQNYKKLRGK